MSSPEQPIEDLNNVPLIELEVVSHVPPNLEQVSLVKESEGDVELRKQRLIDELRDLKYNPEGDPLIKAMNMAKFDQERRNLEAAPKKDNFLLRLKRILIGD